MRITPTGQSKLPPPDKPLIDHPVLVQMDIPLFYMTERGPVPWNHKIFCGKAFAVTVLEEMNALLLSKSLGLVHIGIYNPRKARKRDGTPIVPARWSNHAYGEAMDFKGITTEPTGSSLVGIAQMKISHPDLLASLRTRTTQAIVKSGRKPEVVDEGDWLHIGIWPKPGSTSDLHG